MRFPKLWLLLRQLTLRMEMSRLPPPLFLMIVCQRTLQNRERDHGCSWVPSWENRDLRQLLWHRHRMVQARTRIMNQLQAVPLNRNCSNSLSFRQPVPSRCFPLKTAPASFGARSVRTLETVHNWEVS
jgi:hypothetical protein